MLSATLAGQISSRSFMLKKWGLERGSGEKAGSLRSDCGTGLSRGGNCWCGGMNGGAWS